MSELNEFERSHKEHKSPLVRKRFETAESFYKKSGYKREDALREMKGIDFNSPVRAVTINPGTRLSRFNEGNRPLGQYLSRNGRVDNLGAYGARDKLTPAVNDNHPKNSLTRKDLTSYKFQATKPTRALISKASDIGSFRGTNEVYKGGGTQYFVPKTYNGQENLSNLKDARVAKSIKFHARAVRASNDNSKKQILPRGNPKVTAARLAKSGRSESGIYSGLKQHHPDLAKSNPEGLRRLAKQAHKGQEKRGQSTQAPQKEAVKSKHKAKEEAPSREKGTSADVGKRGTEKTKEAQKAPKEQSTPVKSQSSQQQSSKSPGKGRGR